MPDEFMTSGVAATSKDLISENSAAEFARSREHLRVLVDVLTRVHTVTERLVSSANVYANDMHQLSKELSYIATDVTSVNSWACGTNTWWSQMKKGFRSAAPEFGGLVEASHRQAAKLEEEVSDTVGILLDLLLAYKDLCERHEKGVVSEHQKTIQKLNQYKKKTTAVSRSHSAPEALERLESQILEQEAEISNVENRACFALHCIQMETQLVYANLEVLSSTLQKMSDHERVAHSELAGVWAQICPLLASAVNGRSDHVSTGSHIATNNNISTTGLQQ